MIYYFKGVLLVFAPVHCVCSAHGGQKRASDHLVLELWATMRNGGFLEPGISESVVRVLNCQVTSPVPQEKSFILNFLIEIF